MYLAGFSWAWVVTALAIALAACAVTLVVLSVRRRRQLWSGEPDDNGIRVGAPKVYDNRSLSLMLEALQKCQSERWRPWRRPTVREFPRAGAEGPPTLAAR